jgi:uncharacterized delta-60 repeat protein
MKLNTHQWIGAVLLALALLWPGASSSRAQSVDFFLLAKGQFCFQESDALPEGLLLDGDAGPVQFIANSFGEGLSAAHLRVPGVPGFIVMEDDSFEFESEFFHEMRFGLVGGENTPEGATMRMNAAFPAGTYFVTNFTAGNAIIRSITLAALSTNVLPRSPFISNMDALRAMDPTQPFTLRWIEHGPGTSSEFVQLSIEDSFGDDVVSSPDLGEPGQLTGASPRQFVIPANTFQAGERYSGRLLFANITQNSVSGGTRHVGGFFMETGFEINPVPPQGRIGLAATNFTVGENAGPVVITLTRTGGSSGVASVELNTVNVTAVDGEDYTGSPEPMIVTFADGETTATVQFNITDDSLFESNETFRVVLDDPDDLGGADLARAQATVTIVENENPNAPVFNLASTNLTVSEAVAGVVLTVNRTGDASETNTVHFATENHNAVSGNDYVANEGDLTFLPGEHSKTVSVLLLNDAFDENDETFLFRLSAPSEGSSLGPRNAARVLITDNDTGGRFSFSAAMYPVSELSNSVRVLVRRTGGTAGGARFRITSMDETADEDDDYGGVDEEFTFGSNVVEQAITLPIFGDTLPEGDETFKLALTLPEDHGGALPGPISNAVVKIIDDEISIAFRTLTYSNSEAGPVATIAIVRTGPLTAAAAVHYATADDTAEAGQDYQATNGLLVLPAGMAQKNFTVRLINDALVEGDETILLSLHSPSNALLVAEATNAVLTIGDNDRGGVLQFSSTNITATEAARLATLTVARTGGLASNVTVCLLLEDGPETGGAINPDDYTPTNAAGVVTNKILLEFRAGETRKLIRVPLINDQLAEGIETFRARLEDPTGGASLGARSNTVVQIRDNDVGGKINFSRAAYSVNENGTNLVVTIARTGGAASNVTVIFKSFSNATATAGVDFTAATTPITFGPGQTSTNILVPIINDPESEGNERFQLSLMDPMGGGMVGALSNAVVTIVDDESSISFTNAMYMVNETGPSVTINAVRGGARLTQVSVDVTIQNITASAADHRGTNLTLTFAPNVAFKSIVIPIINDLLDEPDEAFTVGLSHPRGGTQLGTTGTNTIVIIKASDFGGPVPEQPAQTDDFNPAVGGGVLAVAVQSDGKVLLGGSFTTVAGQSRQNLARLNADGSLDESFDPGAEGTVYVLHIQPDGKVLVGGQFFSLGGFPRSNLGRLHPDGIFDESFEVGGFDPVSAVVVQANGQIVVGGFFGVARLQANGTLDDTFDPPIEGSVNCLALQRNGALLVGGDFRIDEPDEDGDLIGYFYLVRFLANGRLDEDFYPDPDGGVTGLLVQPDGKILVSGDFTTLQDARANYVPRSGFARLDGNGNVEHAFNPAPDGAVRTMALQADGRILLGGDFIQIAGQTRGWLARLAVNGTLDNTFAVNINEPVDALALQADGAILVGGGFASLGGLNRQGLGRLSNTSPGAQRLSYAGTTITWLRARTASEVWQVVFERSVDGMSWTNIGPGTRIAGGWQRTGVSLPAGGSIRARGFVAGGSQASSGWLVESYYGRPVLRGQPTHRTNNAGTTATFVVQIDGAEPLSYQWLRDGQPLSNQGNVFGANGPMLTISPVAKANEGAFQLIASNSLGSVTSVVATLVVLDPAIFQQPAGTNLNIGQGATLTVTAGGTPPLSYQWYREGSLLPGKTGAALALSNVSGADAGLYTVVVSNSFGSVTSAPALVSVNLITVDAGFDPGAAGASDASVYALALQPDGRALVGGDFASLDGQARGRLGRLGADGAVDAHFNPGALGGGFPGIFCYAVQADGRILVGGSFTSLAGQPRMNLGRLNPDGSLDATFNPGAGNDAFTRVTCLALQPDGKILVGGLFTSLAGVPRDGLGRLNPNGTLDGAFNPSVSGIDEPEVRCLVLQPDGRILVGGGFTNLAGQTRFGIGRLNANGSPDVTFDPEAHGVGFHFVVAMTLQPDGRILVSDPTFFSIDEPAMHIHRLNADGSLDTNFLATTSLPAEAFALQADGRTVFGGGAGLQPENYLGRFNPDGSPDATFSPAVEGGVFASAFALALQPDGRLVVGGNFTMLGGQSRMNLGRLENLGAATQAVSVAGSTVRWTRGGTAPEVWRTTLEYSSNGLTWVSLGAGTRAAGGWEWTGVSLPPGSTLCAQGRVVAGGQSDWLVEECQGPPALRFQPENRTVPAGDTVTLAARAGGTPPLSYLWFRNGAPLMNQGQVTGADGATLALSPVSAADNGSYHLVVSNALGTATSAMATLTVIESFLPQQAGVASGERTEARPSR